MKLKKKTALNILLIAFIASFFITPLGYYGKVLLYGLFSKPPKVIAEENRQQIKDYNWKLKDAQWDYFNFDKSEGNVIFINRWASWKIPSSAELRSIQKLYDAYKGKIDFYIITDEVREPVEEFMDKNDFTFPVTYLIIGEKTAVSFPEVPSSYLVAKDGSIVIAQEGIAKWNGEEVHATIDSLLAK